MLRRKPMVPGGRKIIDIGDKYNVGEVIYIIITVNLVNTKAGITNLSNYPDHFYNIAIHPVARPLVMYKFFGSFNYFDSHNKSSQSDLVLDKLWDTQCGCILFCTKFFMGMTITNFCKQFRYVVNIDHHEKLIGIREFLEQLALYCFNNTF